ncbi:MAG TPA: prepilin-type N-terminal cleavage/methylation domain-containing protein [Candidatus Hydrogenedentes bacterium]|nr:prepilin-type N-terminal cleavage/methylation domain-containing protein [Candidatus Hydrogenedentota bacterium]
MSLQPPRCHKFKTRANFPESAGQKSGRAAFTLLELVVVVALLSILTAAIVPLYASSMTGARIRNARADLITALRYAQDRAVQESREYRLYLNREEQSWWVERQAGVNENNEKEFEVAADSGIEKRVLPEGLEFQQIKARQPRDRNLYFIACYPHGVSDPAEIVVRDNRVRRGGFILRVSGPDGRIVVREP